MNALGREGYLSGIEFNHLVVDASVALENSWRPRGGTFEVILPPSTFSRRAQDYKSLGRERKGALRRIRYPNHIRVLSCMSGSLVTARV